MESYYTAVKLLSIIVVYYGDNMQGKLAQVAGHALYGCVHVFSSYIFKFITMPNSRIVYILASNKGSTTASFMAS